jgi:hypothetical protein
VNELKNSCELARANRVHFKAPHSVTFVNVLPKTATGKIQKYIESAMPCDRFAASQFTFLRCHYPPEVNRLMILSKSLCVPIQNQ